MLKKESDKFWVILDRNKMKLKTGDIDYLEKYKGFIYEMVDL